MKIAIGSDHIGYELKPTIIEYVKKMGHEVTDFGTNSTKRTDYPIYGKKVAEELKDNAEFEKIRFSNDEKYC